jgi:hypothetical protein
MDKSNLELFKQAISDGLSKKFDSVVNSYADEIVCSEKHRLAMRTIVYGKAEAKRTWSPRMKHIIAIIVAAALLLTSCAVIFRNEICEVVDEFFAKYVYSGDVTGTDTIEEVYELTYLPEGYTFENEIITPLCVQYILVDENDNIIIFEQRILDKSGFLQTKCGAIRILSPHRIPYPQPRRMEFSIRHLLLLVFSPYGMESRMESCLLSAHDLRTYL